VFYSKISRLILLAKLSASVVRNIYSVLILSLIIIYFKLKKKKIIFFYHPKKILTLIHKYYIEDLLEDMSENYSTIYGHEVNKNIGKKYFYIKQGYLKFILNIDLFISNFVCAIDETKDTIITDVNPKLLQRMSMTEDEEYRNAGIDKADAQKEEKEKIIDMYAEKGT